MTLHQSISPARAMVGERLARDQGAPPEALLKRLFAGALATDAVVDARYADAHAGSVIGVGPLPFRAPAVAAMIADPVAGPFLRSRSSSGLSLLISAADNRSAEVLRATPDGAVARIDPLPDSVQAAIDRLLAEIPDWPGHLDDRGRHTVSLKAPTPGPHFSINVLLGNRVGFPHALQTTPKSVVDRFGRGSFRSHAATQVLATRWDMLPEENGFPANRQFYLVEEGRQVFYSAAPHDPNVSTAEATHAPNRTDITYRTRCGLEIHRTIFLLPYDSGLPLAVEVQTVEVRNLGTAPRRLRMVLTGMLGAASPGGLQEDVVYTTVSMQGRVFATPEGDVVAVSPQYSPPWAREDSRFHSTVAHVGGRTHFPTEFTTSYDDFVGPGTLEHPAGLSPLANTLHRRGPGFFALGVALPLAAGETARVDSFTGLVSAKDGTGQGEANLRAQVERLLDRYADPAEVDRSLARVEEFTAAFARHLQLESGDPRFDAYVNHNLPFQVLYQTFVSRSFCLTQKGYREIGFREIQDLFAAMPNFVAMGKQSLVKNLLKEWAAQVHELGFANHNFYWVGKEPGEWSDDALWFVQALGHYVDLTGDFGFLDEMVAVAGSAEKRRLADTVDAILRYSGEISVGGHGLPLLDRADWNDTLRLDPTYLSGPEKAALVARRRASGQPDGPIGGEGSESVMNACLLKVALDVAARLSDGRGAEGDAARYRERARRLADDIQRHAWKDDYFARVLFNRPDLKYTYLGATGDGLSADPSLPGSYFLNSFTWAILADVASESQIRAMLGVIRRTLQTPFGLKLCSPVRYHDITARGGSAEYFPGDRENGGVFKHADMMAVVAMLRAANSVTDLSLAQELRDLAYSVVDVVLPYKCLEDPYVRAGNPRFCTQYNNSETGENVGPILSGTSTWLALALREALGIGLAPGELRLAPILGEEQTEVELTLDFGQTSYRVRITKPRGFARVRDGRCHITLDGAPVTGPSIPRRPDGKRHEVAVVFD